MISTSGQRARICATMRAISSLAPSAASLSAVLQLGGEQMPAAEDVERQVAIAVVVAVEVPALLLAVDRIVRGVQIDDHARGALEVGLHTQRHEQCRNAPPRRR